MRDCDWLEPDVLLASFLLPVLGDLGVTPRGTYLLLALCVAAGTVALILRYAEFLVRFAAWLVTHTVYDITIRGRENIPERGPALLVSNHVTYIDALLIGACFQRFIRFMMFRDFFDHPLLRPFCSFMNAIPIAQGDSASSQASLALAADELRKGHVVCIFAEGMVSRSGNLLSFRKGFEVIARAAVEAGIDFPIIPVHLEGLWGSIFSFEGGRVIFKRPKRLPYPVTVSFGAPHLSDASAYDVRQSVALLGVDAQRESVQKEGSLANAYLRRAKSRWFRTAVSDSLGTKLSHGRLIALADLLGARWRKTTPERIGIILPPSVGGALVNVAATLAGIVPVNLNFTASREAFAHAVDRSGISAIVTSQKMLSRIPMTDFGSMELVLIENELKSLSKSAVLAREALYCLAPLSLLIRRFPGASRPCTSEAALLFSSGSTGLPKGVVLSHENIRANLAGLSQVFAVDSRDRLLGTLPFFHSFGFTATIWHPLIAGFAAHYHPNPLDAKGVGQEAARSKATIFLTTPTFAASYATRIDRESFATLRFTMAGSEQLRTELSSRWAEKFGSPLLEGFGATECAPVIATNTPSRNRPGSVGAALPGVAVRVVDLESRRELGYGREGLLEVRGANVMTGYLGEPEKSALALSDGWYRTGDLATIDREGFIRITGRLSRFSKIAGEMVPQGRVEEVILTTIGCESNTIAVTAVADSRTGERLVALHAVDLDPRAVTRKMRADGFPNLWIPRPDDFLRVEIIPSLGTGKTDLRAVKEMAESILCRRDVQEDKAAVG